MIWRKTERRCPGHGGGTDATPSKARNLPFSSLEVLSSSSNEGVLVDAACAF